MLEVGLKDGGCGAGPSNAGEENLGFPAGGEVEGAVGEAVDFFDGKKAGWIGAGGEGMVGGLAGSSEFLSEILAEVV